MYENNLKNDIPNYLPNSGIRNDCDFLFLIGSNHIEKNDMLVFETHTQMDELAFKSVRLLNALVPKY